MSRRDRRQRQPGDNASPELAARWAVLADRPWEPPPFEAAMVQVARRFFAAYGPAAETDFRYWLSASAAESKAAVETLLASDELTEVVTEPTGNSPRLLPRRDLDDLLAEPPSLSRWPVCLLGRFDPLLLAHADKHCWVDKPYYKRIWHHTHVEAALLVHGRIRGLWRAKRAAEGLSIEVQAFGEATLPRYVERRIAQQAEAIASFVGLPLHQLAVHARS